MSEAIKFIANSVFHIIKILELMRQPNGTSIEEICEELHINRRSVFRLLKIIELKFNKPFIIHRASFGGIASYQLSPSFIEKISGISLPKLDLTFTQAAFLYLILNDNPFSNNNSVPHEIYKLLKCLDPIHDQ